MSAYPPIKGTNPEDEAETIEQQVYRYYTEIQEGKRPPMKVAAECSPFADTQQSE